MDAAGDPSETLLGGEGYIANDLLSTTLSADHSIGRTS